MVINLKKYLTRIEKQSVLKNSMSRTTPILYTCCVTQAPIYSSGLCLEDVNSKKQCFPLNGGNSGEFSLLFMSYFLDDFLPSFLSSLFLFLLSHMLFLFCYQLVSNLVREKKLHSCWKTIINESDNGFQGYSRFLHVC